MGTGRLLRRLSCGDRRSCGDPRSFGARTFLVALSCGAAPWFGVAALRRDSAWFGDRRRIRPTVWFGALLPTGMEPSRQRIAKNRLLNRRLSMPGTNVPGFFIVAVRA